MNIFIATIENNFAVLTSDESWHCCKVLRKKAGDTIFIIDGKGNSYEGILDLVSEKKCMAALHKGPFLQEKRPYYLHLAIAPTKQIDRIEWMIEKAVEIGIDEISFIQCKNSERVVMKHDRIVKIVESAVKQSLQAFIPKVNSIVPFKEILNKKVDQNFIAHCEKSIKQSLNKITFANSSCLVLVGPEGDFTSEEITLALNNGFTGLDLGHNRLRTETAGLYVCQAASILS